MSTSRREVLRSAGAIASAAALASATGAGAQAAGPSQAPGAATGNPADLFDIPDFERAARKAMSPMAWEYISGGAADEITLRGNKQAYEKIGPKPAPLVMAAR